LPLTLVLSLPLTLSLKLSLQLGLPLELSLELCLILLLILAIGVPQPDETLLFVASHYTCPLNVPWAADRHSSLTGFELPTDG
jgi:hypothetical protein